MAGKCVCKYHNQGILQNHPYRLLKMAHNLFAKRTYLFNITVMKMKKKKKKKKN